MRRLPLSSSLLLSLILALGLGCSLQDFDQFHAADQGTTLDGSANDPDMDTDSDMDVEDDMDVNLPDMNTMPDMNMPDLGPPQDFGMGPFELTVSVVGGGTVTAIVGGGIDCGSDCDETYASGTQVILSAAANPGSSFTGWTGACTGDQACVLDLSQPLDVTATFEEVFYTLEVTFDGSGMGTIDGTTALSCDGSGACTMQYPADTEVTLTAAAVSGSAFAGWSGDCGGSGDCVVTLDQDRSVGVTFDESGQLSLLLSKVGDGTGTVTSAPAGIDCGATCSASFDAGMMVTLTAVADADSTFDGWSGDCTGSGDTCDVTLSAARSVSATFSLRTYVLDVQPAGSGSGTVESTVPGIDCGATCQNTYTHGDSVTLVAAEDVGSTFMGWSGGGCSGTSFCTVSVTAATTVTAQFELDNYTLLATTTGGTGSGRIVSQSAGIDCPGDCSEDYDHGTMVTLDALADAGSTFDSWGGACSGQSGAQCVVTITEAGTVSAAFTQNSYQVDVTKSGDGTGTVTSSVGGISCGDTCMATLDHNTMVLFTATADTNSTHIGWGGACSAASGTTCTLTITEAATVDATFILGSNSLAVVKAGDGSGTVSGGTGSGGVDGQITCGDTCASAFTNNDVVTLTAAADTGATFAGWSGGLCSGTGTCVVTITAAASVTATFTADTYPLDITRGGDGGGAVNGTAGGSTVIDCGSDCTETVTHNTMVTLSATADSDSVFTGWSGGGCSGTGPCTVDVIAATTVDAQFGLRPYLLSVGVGGNGNGSVNSAPSGISCGADCEETYLHGDMVSLTATPDADSDFSGWAGGGCTAAVNPCIVSMTQARSVTAAFTLRQYTLTVNKTGNGDGTVSSAAPGISCGGDCSETYDHGTMVVLSAAASTGSIFTGWIGGGCESAGTGDCTVTVDVATSVQAAFVLDMYTVTTTIAATGGAGGTIASSPAGIDCPGTCSTDFNHGTALTLTAASDAVSNFIGWSVTGGGTCAGNTCDFNLTEPASAQAMFELRTYNLSVSVTGEGGGSVTGTGITCGSAGSDCDELFDHGSVVSLTAAEDSGSVFVAWGGACSGNGTCDVTMDQVQNVTASFAVGSDVLTVTTSGTGSGTVTSDAGNPGINCDSETGVDCSEPYTLGTMVTLTASPGPTSIFVGWDSTGPCASEGSNPTCTVTVNALTTVGAQFDTEQFLVLGDVLGNGSGSVFSQGIACPGDCEEEIDSGSTISFTPVADVGSTFVGWHDDCSGTDPNGCFLTVDGPKVVRAEFDLLTFPLSVSVSGQGHGNVTSTIPISSPAGIDCSNFGPTGFDCSEDYDYGTFVTLQANPDFDSDFGGWTHPNCTGLGDCTVEVTEAEFVDAIFDLKRYTVTVFPIGGLGMVSSGDGSIECNAGGSCSATVTHGTTMSLFPTDQDPVGTQPGLRFSHWTSPVCNGNGNCAWVVTADMDVNAHFVRTRRLTVSISAIITGNAKVDMSIGGSFAGACTLTSSPCEQIVDEGTFIGLNAMPQTFFQQYSGSPPCGGAPNCSFGLASNASYLASFQ